MSVAAYPEYKNSGVEWLGDLPAHWVARPLKSAFQIVGGATPKSDNETFWSGDIVWLTPGDLSGLASLYIDDSIRRISALGLESCAATLVPAGSIVLSTRAPIGSLAITTVPACSNQGCKALVPTPQVSALFAAYALSVATEALNVRGRGSTFLEISGDELGAFKMALPPLPEQTAIASFLDRETGKIDALVDEQRQLIALLREKRQAVISHAVTKGLDPNAPMKDSGVEWLGEVPTHWEVMPLRWLYRFVKRQENAGGEVLSVYRDFGVVQKSSRSDNNNKTPEDLSKYQSVYAHDLVINKMKSWQGSLGVSDLFGITSPDYAVFEPIHSENSDYLNLLLRCSMLPDVYRSISNGIRTDQWRLEPEKLRTIGVPVPPAAEQSAIADAMAAMTDEFDTLEQVARSAIELFQERRAALISAAVTGKFDVRGIATQLMEVA